MSGLPEFRLETYFSKWEFTAPYNLAASDAQSMTFARLLELGRPGDREGLESMSLGYTRTSGALDLRELIAGTYDARVADDVLCFAGAEEAIYVAMHALLSAHDHAVVLTPNYQSSETVPTSICRVSGVPLDSLHNWSLDIERVARALRPETKVVSINFPHNPTGKILERECFDALVDLCRARSIWLFSDEVYRPLGPTGAAHLPQVTDVYERGLSLGTMSKSYGLPGLRIGWIASGDRDLLSRMERMKHYLSICNAGPSERLAAIALRARERIFAANRELISANLDTLDTFFANYFDLFEWRRPDGGCVAFPRYLGADGVEAFTERLVEEAGVLLLPSSIFSSELGPTPPGHFRIGLGRSKLVDGLGALCEHLRRCGDGR